MIRCAAVVLLALSLALLAAAPARAQYMYLDFDGDGVYTSNDNYGGYGDSVKVDLYVVTNEYEPGVPTGLCSYDGNRLYSYTVNFVAPQASITVVRIENRMAEMAQLGPAVVHPHALTVSYGGAIMYPEGKHLLMSLYLVFGSGCHALQIVPSGCFSPDGVVTSIGSNCISVQSDDLLRMGEDWTTVQGSNGCNHWSPHPPSVTCPGPLTALIGKPIEINFGIDTPDCDISSFGAYGTNGEGVVGPISGFRYGHADVPFRWTPQQVGTYDIRFEAVAYDFFHHFEYRDGCMTRVTVVEPEIPVRVFTTSSNDLTRLGGGKHATCFQIEPLEGSFTADRILPSSLVLKRADAVCGDLQASAMPAKSPIGDADRNGIPDYAACFAHDEMQTLGKCLESGTQTVDLDLFGHLDSGEAIHGHVSHTFSSKRTLVAAITPNPLKAASAVSFTTSAPGWIAARLYDIRGRLVANLYEERYASPGLHRVPFTALDRAGTRLASGIYFVRLLTEHDGEETRRVTVLK